MKTMIIIAAITCVGFLFVLALNYLNNEFPFNKNKENFNE